MIPVPELSSKTRRWVTVANLTHVHNEQERRNIFTHVQFCVVSPHVFYEMFRKGGMLNTFAQEDQNVYLNVLDQNYNGAVSLKNKD